MMLHNQNRMNTIQGIELGNMGNNAGVKRIKLVVYEPSAVSKNNENRKQFKEILLKQMNCPTIVTDHNIFGNITIPKEDLEEETEDTSNQLNYSSVIKIADPPIQESEVIIKTEPVEEVVEETIGYTISNDLINDISIKSEYNNNNNESLMIAMRSDVPDEITSDSISNSLESNDEESVAITTLSYLMKKNGSKNASSTDSCSSQGSQSTFSQEFSEAFMGSKAGKDYIRKRKIYKYESEKERRENKRDQNKEAARRYREKKKNEVGIYEQKIGELEKINYQKQLELKALETEKKIMVEQLKRTENIFVTL